jgi:hypothetical protein
MRDLINDYIAACDRFMINHESIMKQQHLDQTIIEELEYGNEYGMLIEADPVLSPELFASFKEERYDYGEEKIQIGRWEASIQATKLG